MIDIQTIILFSTASLALAVTSGPDMILVAARSAAQGRMAGLVTQLGVSAGSAFHAIILALGLSQLFLAVPYAYDLVRYLSAAYLLYLAWQAFTERDGFSSKSITVKKLSLKLKSMEASVHSAATPILTTAFSLMGQCTIAAKTPSPTPSHQTGL